MENPKIYISLQEIDRLHKVAHEHADIFVDGETLLIQNDVDGIDYGWDKNDGEEITFITL